MKKLPLLIHNPRCSKSRGALQILEENKISFETLDYLKDGLDEKLLASLPQLLNLSFSAFVRKNEEGYVEQKSDQDWIELIKNHPILLERPIFIKDERAVIGRPPENILELLK